MNGKHLSKILGINAIHALYREDGKWYHHLKKFPGILFDKNGYIVFNTKEDYTNNPYLIKQKDLHITDGISSLSDYVKFSLEELKKIGNFNNTDTFETPLIDKTLDKSTFDKIKSDLETFDEENSDNFEGGRNKRLVNYYERKPHLRAKAILIHGTTCLVCNFNFKKHYGEHGEDYFEVHHLIPISKLIDPTEINPETDMTVLCANCHRMAHRNQGEILSIKELKRIWKEAQVLI